MERRARVSSKAGRGAGVASIKSTEKAFAVLEAFGGQDRLLSLGELSRLSRLDKSTVQRVTRTLLGLGYMEQDPASRRYGLGLRVLDLSFALLRAHPLVQRATSVLVELRRAVRERVDLVLPDGDTVVYVVRMQAKRETFRPALIGRRVPMFCTAAGRVILAQGDDERALEAIRRSDRRAYTPATKTDPLAILDEVRRARRDGYAVQAEEWLPAEMVAAAAVRNTQAEPVGAVNIAVSTAEWSPAEFRKAVAPRLMAAAAELSG